MPTPPGARRRAASRSGRRRRRSTPCSRSIARTSCRRWAAKVRTWATIAAEHEALRRVAQRVDDPVVPGVAPLDVADHREPARRRPPRAGRPARPGRRRRSAGSRSPSIAASQTSLVNTWCCSTLRDRLVRPVEGQHHLPGPDRARGSRRRAAAWPRRAGRGCRRGRGGRGGRAVRSWCAPRCGPTATWAGGSGCRWARAASCCGSAGVLARRVAERAGERPAEALDRLVARVERRVGHRRALPQLPRRPLEHHPAPHRHRRLAGVAGELPAEVVRRGVGAAGHVVEGVVSSSSTASSSSRSRSRPACSVMGPSCSARGRPRPTDLAQPSTRRDARGRRRSGSSWSTQVIRGSLRHHESCRRANRRVAAVGPLDGLLEGELAARGGRPPRGSRSRGPRCGPQRAPRRAAARPPRPGRRRTSGGPARRSARPAWAGRWRRRPGRCAGSTYSSRGSDAVNGRPVSSHDLERADDPAAVVGQDPRRRLGVDLRQPGVQRGDADLGELVLELPPQTRRRCRGTRTGRAPRGCRAPSRPPGPAPRRGPRSVGDHGPRLALELRDADRPRTVVGVEQVVRRSRAARPAGSLAVPMSMPAVDLHRVGVDDLAARAAPRGRARARSCPRRWRRRRPRSGLPACG